MRSRLHLRTLVPWLIPRERFVSSWRALAITAFILAHLASMTAYASTTPTTSFRGHSDELNTDIILTYLKPEGSATDTRALSRQFHDFWSQNEAFINKQTAKIVVVAFSGAEASEIQRGNEGIGAFYVNVKGADGKWSPPDEATLGRVIEWRGKIFGRPMHRLFNIFDVARYVVLLTVLLVPVLWWRRRRKLAKAKSNAPVPAAAITYLDVTHGFPVEQPPVVVPWGISEAELVSLFDGQTLHHVTDGYYTIECTSLSGLRHRLGFHFNPRKDGVLEEFEFFRDAYPDLAASYREFQFHLTATFGPPVSTKPGTAGYLIHLWTPPGGMLAHTVADRFGLEERISLTRR